MAFELFEEDAVLGDFGFDVSVGGAGDADADGAGGGVAGHADDADVVGEILAAELCADAGFGAEVVDFFFPVEVAEGAAAGAAGGGKGVVVAGGGELDGFKLVSALVPPMTMARWYGGQAEVPMSLSFCWMKLRRAGSLRRAGVCW